jgi:hypothetical protein
LNIISPQTLRRPSNWQDFETLCKKLWSEIWKYPETKKNGRIGQNQHGVDVYGMLKGTNEYIGIQCKGKDEYTDKQFSEKEISDEIEKAKNFTPALRKLYFATTAVKDAAIESFVRQKNLEHINAGLFEVHIYCWEDIVDLIDENRETHDFYVKDQNYKSRKEVILTFDNDEQEVILKPKFKKEYIKYRQSIQSANPYYDSLLGMNFNQGRVSPMSFSSFEKDILNLSFSSFRLKLQNVGLDAIEEFKLIVIIEGNVEAIRDNNFVKQSFIRQVSQVKRHSDVCVEGANSIKVVPTKQFLVGDETYLSDEIFLKPGLTTPTELIVNWKLISKDYKTDGLLIIKSVPEVVERHTTILVDDPLKVGDKENAVEEFHENAR